MKVICKKCKAAIDEARGWVIVDDNEMNEEGKKSPHLYSTAEIDGDRHSYDGDGDILTSAIKDGLPRWMKDSSDE